MSYRNPVNCPEAMKISGTAYVSSGRSDLIRLKGLVKIDQFDLLLLI